MNRKDSILIVEDEKNIASLIDKSFAGKVSTPSLPMTGSGPCNWRASGRPSSSCSI